MYFRLKHLLKHNRPGDPLDTIVVPAYPQEQTLCPLQTVLDYLERTKMVRRKQDQLLLITRAPFTPAARDTVSTWTKQILPEAGIDTDHYKAHSTRGATTSKVTLLRIDINVLLKQASWKSEETYGRFYNKTIEKASFEEM